MAAAALITCLPPGLNAQLVADVTAIPAGTGRVPVVFLNGYQFGCTDRPTFAGTFGTADQILAQSRTPVLFFNNCDIAGNPAIEELGNAFGRYLTSLRYSGGGAVPQVDVVAHSMGGMIIRSYLSGKQQARGVFQPPAEIPIRKAVFLAVPFFGAVAADLQSNDVQSSELQRGSAFVFDLATWNQGIDDLRGIDAVAVVANGGSGVPNGPAGFNDSTVSVTSASFDFAQTGRTRVVNHCHTTLTFPLSVACRSGIPAVAAMTSGQHESARIMVSFLNGTNDWQSVGLAPSATDLLRDRGGVAVQVRDARDQIVPVTSATTTPSSDVRVRSNEVAWSENVPSQNLVRVTATTASGQVGTDIPFTPGRSFAVVATTGGPIIRAVIPNFAVVSPRAVAPGSFISIYGDNLSLSIDPATASPYPLMLGGAQVLLNDQPIGLHFASPTQINALVPDSVSDLVKLTVRTPNGVRTVNLLVEASVPTLYSVGVNGNTGAVITSNAPARPGNILILYLTGLGLAERRPDGLDWARIQPQVTAGGQPCALQYAGRTTFPGLDQINCQLSTSLTPNDATPVVVSTGKRSATINIPVR